MIQACLLFTVMGELAHALKESCPWQLVAATRAGLVFAFVALFAWARGKRLFLFNSPTLWLRSIAGSLSMVCTFYAFSRLPLSDTLTLTNMFPIWIALLSWPLLGEKPSVPVWVAIVSGATGVWLIQRPHLGTNGMAIAAAAAASVFTAIAMLGLHKLSDVDPTTIVVHFSGVATCFCLGAFFLLDRSPQRDLPPVAIGAILLGIGLTAALGQLLLTRAFAAGEPSRVAVVSMCQIVFALVPDVLIFKHPLHVSSLFGIVLIAAPTAWVLLRSPRLAHAKTAEGRDPDESRPSPHHSQECHPIVTVQPERPAPAVAAPPGEPTRTLHASSTSRLPPVRPAPTSSGPGCS